VTGDWRLATGIDWLKEGEIYVPEESSLGGVVGSYPVSYKNTCSKSIAFFFFLAGIGNCLHRRGLS